jgi:hypothetical protein
MSVPFFSSWRRKAQLVRLSGLYNHAHTLRKRAKSLSKSISTPGPALVEGERK